MRKVHTYNFGKKYKNFVEWNMLNKKAIGLYEEMDQNVSIIGYGQSRAAPICGRQKCGLPALNLKHINQDIVENCFSQIRNFGHRNNNPSPHQFSASFKTLMCTNLTSKKSLSSNCEENEQGTSLGLLKMFYAGELASLNEEDNTDVEYSEAAIPQTTDIKIYVDAQKILRNITRNTAAMECPKCTEYLKGDRVLEDIKKKVELAEIRFPYFCYERKVKKNLVEMFHESKSIMNTIHCPTLQQALDEEIAREFIMTWCIIINNILNGKIEVQEENFMFQEARKMNNKFKKKLNKTYRA